MANNTNLYLDKILLEHPTAVWALDEEPVLSDFLNLTNIDSLYPSQASKVIPIQSTSNGGGYMSFTTTGNHGFSIGEHVVISGVTPSAYNGKYTVLGINSNTSFYVGGPTTGNISGAGTVKKSMEAYKIESYNSEKYPGYVLASNPLYTKTPIAHGSLKSQYGSFMLPSFGFLSEDGKYGQYTFETWVKIKRLNSTDKFKLIGLMNTDPETDDGNGLYYNNTSFILKIGNKSNEAFIKQMNKPMLIQITYSENLASLFVNGEQLINLVLEEEDLALLQNPTTSSENCLVLQAATFDCPAIYPYKLSASQIKMHYAYGQAVSMPETINKSYGAATVSVDFPSARYASNLNYPLNAEWKNGVSEGLDVKKYSISNEEFELPVFNFYDTVNETSLSKNNFITTLAAANQPWKPKYGSFSSVNSNIEFESLDVLKSRIQGFYIDCYSSALPSTSEKTIFKIVNKINRNYLKITLQYVGANIEVKYRFKYNSNVETLVATKTNPHYLEVGPGRYNFLIGLSIDKFSTQYNSNISSFFNNLEELTMFALGDNDLTIDTTPDVTVRWIKFLSQYQLDKLNTLLINADGTFFYPANATVSTNQEAILNSAVGNYQLNYIQNKKTYNTSYTYSSLFSLENYFSIGTSGYWKDDTPLVHFAKYVKDASANDVYTFNNIQFNIDYDAPPINTAAVSGIKYFDTSLSNVKTYITFETTSSNYREDSYFSNGTKQISLSRVVAPDANWATTKYEVVDGSIIYPPTGVDISTLKIVTHIEIEILDTVNNKVDIKSLEMCSQALSLNTTIENPVYTKYGKNIIPYTYTLSGATKIYNYSGVGNARNPFIIEKKTSPYLSLERLSGIRLLELDSPVAGVYRGIRIPLNEKQNSKSKLSSIQMFLYYDATIDVDTSNLEVFQFELKEIFNIVSLDRTLSTVLGTSGGGVDTSLPVSTVNDLGYVDPEVQYYINGELEANPTIKTNEWTVLTIVFAQSLNFDNFVGEFNITGPFAIDNLVFYGFTDKEFLGGQNVATWEDVKTSTLGINYTWEYWLTPYTWLDLQTSLSLESYPISPSSIYGSFVGTNILYPGFYNRNDRITAHDIQYNVYGNYQSSKYIYSAD